MPPLYLKPLNVCWRPHLSPEVPEGAHPEVDHVNEIVDRTGVLCESRREVEGDFTTVEQRIGGRGEHRFNSAYNVGVSQVSFVLRDMIYE